MEPRVYVVTESKLKSLGFSVEMIKQIAESEHIQHIGPEILVIPVEREEPQRGFQGLPIDPVMLQAMMYVPEQEELIIPEPTPKKRQFRFKSPNWNF